MCSIQLKSGNKHFIGGIWNNMSPYVIRKKKTIIRVEYICGGGGSVSVSELAGNMVRPLVGQKLWPTIFRLALLKSLATIKILSGWRDCRLLIKKLAGCFIQSWYWCLVKCTQPEQWLLRQIKPLCFAVMYSLLQTDLALVMQILGSGGLWGAIFSLVCIQALHTCFCFFSLHCL